MKIPKVFSIFILVFALICFTVNIAIAGRGCQSPTGVDPTYFIQIDKNAPGTKYDATLTIYYEEDPTCTCSNLKNMYFFMRLEGNIIKALDLNPLDPGADDEYLGQEYLGFSSVAQCTPYWVGCGYTGETAAEAQQTAIEEFFKLWVVPEIYDCDPSDCPSAKVKSVKKIIEDSPFAGSDMEFMIMDLVIAIDD